MSTSANKLYFQVVAPESQEPSFYYKTEGGQKWTKFSNKSYKGNNIWESSGWNLGHPEYKHKIVAGDFEIITNETEGKSKGEMQKLALSRKI